MAPTAQFYALFTHVKPTIAIGQSPLGTVSISKVCNEIGDDVTLTATPDESKNATFDYWVNMNTQEKIYRTESGNIHYWLTPGQRSSFQER